MGLTYENLDEATRAQMLEELRHDVERSGVYLSGRLTDNGKNEWVELLREAATSGTDDSLATRLRERGFVRQEEQRKKPSGGSTTAKVPHTAPDTLAEGEFNRLYARALCRRAIAEGCGLEVYRGKEAKNPRSESEAKIGTAVDPEALLADLRKSVGVEPALGLPSGPNSGLTVRLR